jgi:N-glycosylase/DNA lyase
MTRPRSYRGLEELRVAHAARGPAIRKRLAEFAAVPRDAYFFELVYCLLTPQSSAVNAGEAVAALESLGRFDEPEPVAAILGRRSSYIRFHRTKARRVCEAAARMAEILQAMGEERDAEALRAWLVHNVRGLGWKEASHFLRNVGYRNLAILDRHILRNLRTHGALRSIPAVLTPGRYRTVERAFRRFASAVEIPLDELDLLFWSGATGRILK